MESESAYESDQSPSSTSDFKSDKPTLSPVTGTVSSSENLAGVPSEVSSSDKFEPNRVDLGKSDQHQDSELYSHQALKDASERISHDLDDLSRSTGAFADGKRQRFQELWEQAQNGSATAASDLVKEFRPSILAVIRRHLNRQMRRQFDSEDLLQSIWLSLFSGDKADQKFDASHDLIGFIHKIARYKSIDKFRKHVATQRRDLRREIPATDLSASAQAQLQSSSESPSRAVQAREAKSRLLAGEPSAVCNAVDMRANGMTFKEIAAQTGLHEDSVRRMLRRLKKRLKQSE